MLEISSRIYHLFYRDIPLHRSIGYFHNSELGWSGKLILGDPSTMKYKIFFIGDSFTRGTSLEEKYLYYNIIKNKLDVELFVYGGGAQGTTQEYMAINKYFDYVRPDLVILQVCNNDFINNSWELETASFIYNDFRVRPYLINGKIEYRFPRLYGKLVMFLSHSRFFYILLNRLERLYKLLAIRGILPSVEQEIRAKGMGFDKFKKSVEATDLLVAKIKDRIGDTPLIAFPVDDEEPYFEQFKRIFKKNDIEFIGEVVKATRAEEAKRVNIRLKNGHFNEIGNKICGEVLIKALKRLNYMVN